MPVYSISYNTIIYTHDIYHIESICTSLSTTNIQNDFGITNIFWSKFGALLFAKAILISMLLGVPQQAQMGRSGDASQPWPPEQRESLAESSIYYISEIMMHG